MVSYSAIIDYLCNSVFHGINSERVLVEILGLKRLVSVAALAMLIVLGAMMVDLASGLYKAKLRGELRTSEGLRRTLMKFITYEGGMLIAVGVDMLLHLSQLGGLFGLQALEAVPVVTCLVGVFLLIVELLSVREKADAKTRKNLDDTAQLALKLAAKEELLALIQQALENQKNKDIDIDIEE
jgi:hypothetical protein